jgi:hypothetical protein
VIYRYTFDFTNDRVRTGIDKVDIVATRIRLHDPDLTKRKHCGKQAQNAREEDV